MEQALQLFGYLILTVLGFVLPVMAIVLSVSHEGISKLASQYENEKTQSEDNIREQLAKLAKAKTTNEAAILDSLNKLKAIKKNAEARLSYLDPKKLIIRLFIPLALALLGVITTFLLIDTSIYYCLFLIIAIIGFAYAIVVFWKLICIIVEVRKIVDADKKDTETRTIELLSALVEKIDKTGQYYLQKIYITLEGKEIKDDSYETTIPVNTKKEIEVRLRNSEMRMAKNVEAGLRFPTSFIIDKTDYDSIFRDEKWQIVRYLDNMLHGNTVTTCDNLIITPLERGEYKIRTFVKAENIETTYRTVTIKVT